MIDIITLIKEYLKSKSLQEFINNRFWDSNRLVIPQSKDENEMYDYTKWMKIVSQDGRTFFYWDELVITLKSVMEDYSNDDIRKDDIVLDIGGCIGAYALQICHDVKHVYVVEPLLDERIRKNIELTNRLLGNNINNVDILKCALGSEKGNINISFQGNNVIVPSHTLTEIKEMCGGHIDVLKCDCEGGEWSIKPEEFEGIRRIEMEVHTGSTYEFHGGTSRAKDVTKIDFTDESKKAIDYINMLTNAGFKCTYKTLDNHTTLVHAYRK